MVVFLRDFSSGGSELGYEYTDLGLPSTLPSAEDMLLMRSGFRLGGEVLVGEKYQLELFLPEF